MDIVFIGLIVFLFVLAVFDLTVGVSNDAVNFLNSALGSKAAKFRTVIIVAAIGVFIGAVMSNGMMDIARHGIFRPENLSFYDVICIFMAVMVTDIILLDVFNTLGMPTSTTVSLVFELLGATFAVSLIKMTTDSTGLTLGDLINTEKALSVILGIFLSVAIAFVFGTVVQFLSRMVFSFEYRSSLKWKIGLFGGVASTAIIYFLLIKGISGLSFMTPEVKGWIGANTWLILGGCFVAFTLLSQLLYAVKVNVFKMVVLLGTFSLAMAFAGNDLVNFIGVPLTGLAAFQDYAANGGGAPHDFLMASLRGSADTPFYFLLGAGVIMVVSLATSKKSRNVSKTEIGLGSQQGGDEMFGSSRVARRVVRLSLGIHSWLRDHIPGRVRHWIDSRFDTTQTVLEHGAAFDLIRGSMNLMLAGILIAWGTSMKLPLSTTFVTFMVAMGTSLADRAWGRESAVFRITGVISVIGGWFITAAVAFLGAGIIVTLMHLGGTAVIVVCALLAVALLIRSNIRFRKAKREEMADTLFQTVLTTSDLALTWPMTRNYIVEAEKSFLVYLHDTYREITRAFADDDARALGRTERSLEKEKDLLKASRRKQTLCLRRVPRPTAIEMSAWFHLSNNSCMAMAYNLRRINEVCREHVDNNFNPLPAAYRQEFEPLREQLSSILSQAITGLERLTQDTATELRGECNELKDKLGALARRTQERLRTGSQEQLAVGYVYLNMLQETQEMVSSLRKLLRASYKLQNN